MTLVTKQVRSPSGIWVEARDPKAPETSYVRVRWNLNQSPLQNHFKAVRHYLRVKEGLRVSRDIPPTAFAFTIRTPSGEFIWDISEEKLKSYFYGGHNDIRRIPT